MPYGPKPKDPRIRLEARLDKLPGGCWEIRRSRNAAGYGNFTLNGKQTTAHRAAYQIYVGPVRDDQVVRHTCDNPPCCNPEHLLVGTQKDNAADMYARGRNNDPGAPNQRGEGNNAAKVTERQAQAVLDLYAQGWKQFKIAEATGVNRQNVWMIVHGKSWTHLKPGFDSSLPNLIAEFTK